MGHRNGGRCGQKMRGWWGNRDGGWWGTGMGDDRKQIRTKDGTWEGDDEAEVWGCWGPVNLGWSLRSNNLLFSPPDHHSSSLWLRFGSTRSNGYSIQKAPPNMPIVIDPNTGALTTTKKIDREEAASYFFTVVATDKGTPPLVCCFCCSFFCCFCCCCCFCCWFFCY